MASVWLCITLGKSMNNSLNMLHEYLLHMKSLRASDLFLRAGKFPAYRIDGRIERTSLTPPTENALKETLKQILTPIALQRFQSEGDLDVAYTVPGNARFRINVFLHGGSIGLVARLIPLGAVDFTPLHLPHAVLELVDAPSGLLLVVGPTGCGKSTTLAALVHHLNATRNAHIVTIEDPIEFVHEEIQSLVHQRVVGYDTRSFAVALRHVVRQNPDIIMIGEMRDQDTVQTALSAALTGHLILSTLHTTNVVQSIDRILSYFPPEAQQQARADLANTLVGIVSMRLLPRLGGTGRIPAVEILRGTPTIRRILLEGHSAELYDIMKRSNDFGMCTFNQSLVRLCREGWLDPRIAVQIAPNPDEFRLNMEGMFTGIDSIDLRTELCDHKEESSW